MSQLAVDCQRLRRLIVASGVRSDVVGNAFSGADGVAVADVAVDQSAPRVIALVCVTAPSLFTGSNVITFTVNFTGQSACVLVCFLFCRAA